MAAIGEGKPKSILLIEDNPADARLIEEMLIDEAVGLDLVRLDRLQPGLERLSKGGIDVVLLDLRLPDSAGLETLRSVHAATPAVPIVVLTGLADEELAVDAIGLGAQDYLVKGHFGGNMLARAIRYAIERNRSETGLRESEERYRVLAEAAHDVIFVNDRDGVVTYANSGAERQTGIPRDRIVGRSQEELFPPEVAEQNKLVVREVFDTGTPVYVEAETPFGGREAWTGAWLSPIRDDAGAVTGVLGVLRDMTEQKRAEETRFRLASIVELSDDAIISTTIDGTIVTWNSAAERVFGYTAEEVAGRSMEMLIPPDMSGEASRILDRARKGRRAEDHETGGLRKDGKRIDIAVTVSPIEDVSGTSIGASAIVRDITRKKAAQREMRRRAYHDVLTDLPNRRLFSDRLGTQLAQAERYRETLAVLFLDLDYFKLVNDGMGHHVGDGLIKAVSTRLRALLRKSETIARIGGDEFLVMLPKVAPAHSAAAVSARILGSFTEPFAIEGSEIHITTSIGIALYPEDGTDGKTLTQHSDIAMYAAKKRGRDRFQFFKDLSQEEKKSPACAA